jgi:hypothetical protein
MTRALPLALSLTAAAVLAGCATTAPLPPAQAIRYHLGDVGRGSVQVTPVGTAQPSLEYQGYARAVEAELTRNGYTVATAGTPAQYVATVAFRRANEVGPPRRSPISIGLGGGGFSGGGYRGGGGVGLGGGVSFPLGGGRGRDIVASELEVVISRRADQTRVWEGRAQAAADAADPASGTDALAARLAAAAFTGFPGESGRTIEVK